MIYDTPPPPATPLRRALRQSLRMDETVCVEQRLDESGLDLAACQRIEARARTLIRELRENPKGETGLEAFFREYALSTGEGVMLMALAEALMRIPDTATADRLIAEKIGGAAWAQHLGRSSSSVVNVSTWALALTGRLLKREEQENALHRLARRSGEAVVRQAAMVAMKVLGRHFVLGATLEEALDRALPAHAKGDCFSFDMLGEAARSDADALRYCAAYETALEAVGARAGGRGPQTADGISVKLSALYPRFETSQRDRVMTVLVPRLKALCQRAARYDIALCLDAEESERLDLTLDVLEAIALDPDLAGWSGLGLAVQAYQKRAVPCLRWLADLSRRSGRRLMVRLVKGAYWDTEIKAAQVGGLEGYPVFTRKASTDVSFLACARLLFDHPESFYPAFATHNAHSVTAILDMAPKGARFEFQRLHGMGEALYEHLRTAEGPPVRIYAPVGPPQELLPYLVRRLLENGANTSFVHRLNRPDVPVEALAADPLDQVRRLTAVPHPRLPLPRDLYGSRRNSRGLDLADPATLEALAEELATSPGLDTLSTPPCRVEEANAAVVRAAEAQPAWDATPASDRAAILERAAALFEDDMATLMALAVREAGKTLPDALGEVREAVDFLRYYAQKAREDFAEATPLPGPTGESNLYRLQGRGVFICISPWNFPLAIFTGQVAAALAAGNSVVAKPAEQTPHMAAHAVALLQQAGLPHGVLHLTPGPGDSVGAALVAHPRIAGVAFTGSTATARAISRRLAEKDGPIVPLIAETGGLNAMIVDSSALPEQVVRDVVISAFHSAGQRCSAARVLFLQEDTAERTLTLLAGAMELLRLGDPAFISTDIGPVIDEAAKAALEPHQAELDRFATLIARTPTPPDLPPGPFFAPCAYEIDRLDRLSGEVFGPILHILRFPAGDLEQVVDQINASGYGLTLGIHSRLDSTVQRIVARARVGNIYVNRTQIGAVVGSQPFGGEGLSGTGPKTGGPLTLHRFAVERVITTDTTAAGGNASLLAGLEEA